MLAPSDDEPPQERGRDIEPLRPAIDARGGAFRASLAARAKQLTAAAALLMMLGGLGWAGRSYLRHRAAAPTTGTVVLESVPTGSEVSVDGTPVGQTPTSRELPPGRHVVEFRRRNVTRAMTLEVEAGRSALGRLDWNAKRMGRLHVESYPSGATVTVDGRSVGVTPLTAEDVTEGPHAVVLKGDNGSVRRSVVITAGQTSELSETIFAGWLTIASPIELAITEGGRAVRFDDRNQIMLTPGAHDMQLDNRALDYHEVRHVDIKPGEVTRVSIVPAPSTITVTATLPSIVVIDEERVGDTPVTSHPVNLGTRNIVVKAASGVEKRFTITVTTAPVRLEVDFSRP